jgi:hypothetical protein
MSVQVDQEEDKTTRLEVAKRLYLSYEHSPDAAPFEHPRLQ